MTGFFRTSCHGEWQIDKKLSLRLSSFSGVTGDEAFKSICRVLGPRAKKPTLGVQHAVEAGYLFKEHASISAWFFNFLSYCEVTKPLTRIKTITRMRRIYKRRLVIPGFIISE